MGGYLTCIAELVSGVELSDSVMHVYVSFCSSSFPIRLGLLHNVEQSLLC